MPRERWREIDGREELRCRRLIADKKERLFVVAGVFFPFLFHSLTKSLRPEFDLLSSSPLMFANKSQAGCAGKEQPRHLMGGKMKSIKHVAYDPGLRLSGTRRSWAWQPKPPVRCVEPGATQARTNDREGGAPHIYNADASTFPTNSVRCTKSPSELLDVIGHCIIHVQRWFLR